MTVPRLHSSVSLQNVVFYIYVSVLYESGVLLFLLDAYIEY